MRFAIRDDDTNYFTTPEQLTRCYQDIWQVVPPTLFLISKVKGNWSQWVHTIYQEKHQTDWKAWEADNTIYPIEENNALINFLRENLQKGFLDIGFHAIHHRNEDATLPTERNNNYVRGAEFFTNRDRTQDIIKEVEWLNQLLNYKITVFSPPQNLLSLEGYHAVIQAGLNICGGGIAFYKKGKNLQGLKNLYKQLLFKILHPKDNYPYVLAYRKHTEIPYHYPLQPTTQLEHLINGFENVRKYNGDFILSTHYVEFDYPTTYNTKLTMKDVLLEFLNYISKYDLKYCSVSEMLRKKQ
jgi:hypothetical protein